MSSPAVTSQAAPRSEAVDIEQEREKWAQGLDGSGSLQGFLQHLRLFQAEASRFPQPSETDRENNEYMGSLGIRSFLPHYMRTFPQALRVESLKPISWVNNRRDLLGSESDFRLSISTLPPLQTGYESLKTLSEALISFMEAASTSPPESLSKGAEERLETLETAIDALEQSHVSRIQSVHAGESRSKTKLLVVSIDWAIANAKDEAIKNMLKSSQAVLQQCQWPSERASAR